MIRPRAFTLVELLAVTAIMALLATAVGLRYAGSLRRGNFQSALEELAFLDRTTRRAALESAQPQVLYFDLFRQSIHRVSAQSGSGPAMELPPTVRIERALTLDRESTGETLQIGVGVTGRSGTYALHLTGPERASQWMLVIGMTGEIRFFDEEEDVRSLIRLTRQQL